MSPIMDPRRHGHLHSRGSVWSVLHAGPRSGLSKELLWAPLGPADNAQLAALIARAEIIDNPPYRTTEEETREYFLDPVYSGVAGRDSNGVMRAFGLVRLRPAEYIYASVNGVVDPLWRGRGIGSSLLHWQNESARHLIGVERANALEHRPARIVATVLEHDKRFAEHLMDLGFSAKRWYLEMRRPLSLPTESVELDRFLTIVPWTDELDKEVLRTQNSTFSQGWGFQEMSQEEWQSVHSFFRPDWSFVALDKSSDRTKIAGYLMSSCYEQDWEALGWSEGYTDTLVVGADYRQRHIGRALLTAALNAYTQADLDYAAAGVDTDNPTGAVHLYESLDYQPTQGTVLYALEV